MGIFGLKTKKTEKTKAGEAKQSGGLPAVRKETGVLPKSFSASIIKRPRMTEKSHNLGASSNAYVFEVSESANKAEVAKAIEGLYKVKPIKITMVKIPRKKKFVRGKIGFSQGGKKAYVYLKTGDKIEIA